MKPKYMTENMKISNAYHSMYSIHESSDLKPMRGRRVDEGAGAGYTVHIKDLKFGNIIDKKLVKGKERYDDYYECKVEILPGEYKIAAENYYDDFFWEIHEYLDEEPTANIDGGVATIAYSTNSYDEDEAEEELRHEVAGRTMDIAFSYGWGWIHVDLPKDKIESDYVVVERPEFYGSIDKIELIAPGLADAVNAGHRSTFDRGAEEESDEEEVGESCCRASKRMKRGKRKIVESGASGDDSPKIYVSTYAKYNNGSLDGAWVTLTDFPTYEDFVEHCRNLHRDERDPEFMVQDYEFFPDAWYSESGLPSEETFDKIQEYASLDDDERDAYAAYLNIGFGNEDIDDFRERYQGYFSTPTDFAYDLVDSLGWEAVGESNLENYFDFDQFGRDLMMDYHLGDEDEMDAEGNPQDPGHYYDSENYDMGEYKSDEQVGMDYVDSLGGVSELGSGAMENYFDYEAFGRDLLIGDYTEYDGYYFNNY